MRRRRRRSTRLADLLRGALAARAGRARGRRSATTRTAAAARPRRRARPGGRQARARDRRRRRPQPADGRAAGRRQDDARAAAARASCRRPASRRRSRSRGSTASPGSAAARLATERPVPRAAPHDLARRGWSAAARAPRPGEITLAHRGVLFLDELPSSRAPALEALRQPLEEGRVEIMRGQRSLDFPARVMLVAAVQPLPVRAAARQLRLHRGRARPRYARRLSGPLLDRIDLVCQVEPRRRVELVGERRRSAEPSRGGARARGGGARAPGAPARAARGVLCNGDMDGRLTRRHVPLDGEPARAAARGPRPHPAERPRPRPRAAGRAHDRRPRRPRRARASATSTRRSATGVDSWERSAA